MIADTELTFEQQFPKLTALLNNLEKENNAAEAALCHQNEKYSQPILKVLFNSGQT